MIKFDNNGYLDKKFGSEGIVEIDSDARDIFIESQWLFLIMKNSSFDKQGDPAFNSIF